MKVLVATVHRNEKRMVPFFLRHYERFADTIIVYDNQSTDGSREMLEKHKKVKIIPYNTFGKLDDGRHAHMKSVVPYKFDADWFIIVDFDEFINAPGGDVRGQLRKLQRTKINFPTVEGFQMVSETFPKDDGKSLMTDLVKRGFFSPPYGKRAVIRKGLSVKYTVGCHIALIGRDAVFDAELRYPFQLLHYSFLGRDNVVRKAENQNLSANNIINGWGTGGADPAYMAAQFDGCLRDSSEDVVW